MFCNEINDYIGESETPLSAVPGQRPGTTKKTPDFAARGFAL